MKRGILSLFFVAAAVACGERSETTAAAPATAPTTEYVEPQETTTVSTTGTLEGSTQTPAAAPTGGTVVAAPAAVPPPAAKTPPPVTPAPTSPPPVTKPAPVAPTAQTSSVSLAATVIDASQFSDPKTQETYRKAKQIADRLDKLYCYCRCKENPGLKHRSLLTCFQSDHAAECGICLNEAEQAWLDWRDDMPIETTIKSIDLVYNAGHPAPSMPEH